MDELIIISIVVAGLLVAILGADWRRKKRRKMRRARGIRRWL